MKIILLVLFIFIVYIVYYFLKNRKSWKKPKDAFPQQWRSVLLNKISFYNALAQNEKEQFEYKVQEFLLNHRITGIHTTINITDKLLVASSAIIPIFKFKDWVYTNLYEVLLYPNTFNHSFETAGEDRKILGMVGTGYMEGKMILSKPALHHGFSNESDKKNTAIHEFVHLIDKSDGAVDGIPQLLLQKQYAIPWLELINKEIDKIYQDKSDINPYGGTNKAEFFAVVSEYFFERPKLLEKKHPKLYALLEKIFKHDMTTRKLNRKKLEIGRNSPCPCNSGLKFKQCCGKI